MLALVTRLVVLENGSVIADGPRDKILKMLRDKADVRDADAGKTHQVQNIVIPQQTSPPPIRVAEASPTSGGADSNSGSKKVPGSTTGSAPKQASPPPNQNDNGTKESKAPQASKTPKSKKAEVAK